MYLAQGPQRSDAGKLEAAVRQSRVKHSTTEPLRSLKESKHLIYVAKSKDHKQKDFETDDMEKKYDCAKRYNILCMNCANGVLSGL